MKTYPSPFAVVATIFAIVFGALFPPIGIMIFMVAVGIQRRHNGKLAIDRRIAQRKALDARDRRTAAAVRYFAS